MDDLLPVKPATPPADNPAHGAAGEAVAPTTTPLPWPAPFTAVPDTPPPPPPSFAEAETTMEVPASLAPPLHQTVLYRLPQYGLPSEELRADSAMTALGNDFREYEATIPPAPNPLSFKHLLWHGTLVVLTAITTTLVGWLMTGSLGQGLLYSFALLMIIGAHELGHYIACRWYGVDATLPYFLPSPLPPVGTFGAFIKIRSPIPSRKALFDIGIAGPLAGFAFILPAAALAHYFAEPAPSQISAGDAIIFNDPLLFKFFLRLFALPPQIDASSLWFAAWVGALMTALNLMPVGQLDGGHVVYALFGTRGHRLIAWLAYLSILALAIYSYRAGGWMGWFVYVVMLTVMMRAGHPVVLNERESVGLGRVLVALIGLLVFMLCFLPLPITM